jgi:transcriptional regulator with XRE-family HTH domain
VTTANDHRLSELLAELPGIVKIKRQQRHLSLRQAGALIGMAYADLSRFENGLHDPQWSTVVKLLRWLEDDPYASQSEVS